MSDRQALNKMFEYFDIDADMSKVSFKDGFASMKDCWDEIKKYELIVQRKKKKLAALKESYRLANEFSDRVEEQGFYLRHDINKNVDQYLLRGFLLSRGLNVVAYIIEFESGVHSVSICPIEMEKGICPLMLKSRRSHVGMPDL